MFRSIVIIIVVFLSFGAFLPNEAMAQKVKYKDLYYLLSSKKYDQAEPFLKTFLAESEKNADHPNGNYQMGLIYKYKSETADIFLEAAQVWIFTDSAIHFLNRAKELVTDKEVKRNSEYYEEFSKRDMRTGKVSIKAFDVQFSIEDMVEKMKTRQELVGEANAELENVITKYNISREFYIGYKSKNNNMSEMLIRAKLETIGALDQLIDTYDSFLISFDRMLAMLKEIPNAGYNQKMTKKSITDLATQGDSESHFLEPEVSVWNYLEWAKNAKSIILSEILPLKAEMVKHDESLESLLEQTKESNTFSEPDYKGIKQAWSGDILLKYDEDPLPIKLFNLRYAELEYLQSVIKFEAEQDSTNIAFNIELAESELALLKSMDSTVTSITELNIDEQIRNYKDFVDDRYHGFLGLDKYLKDKLKAVDEYEVSSTQKLEDLVLRNAYMLVDTSKVFIDSAFVTENSTQVPLVIEEKYSSGIIKEEGDTRGYLVEINARRNTNFFYDFSLDSVKQMTNPNAIVSTDPSGEIHYLLYFGDTVHVAADEIVEDLVDVSTDTVAIDGEVVAAQDSVGTSIEPVEEELGYKVIYPSVMAKVYKVDGVAWIVPLSLTDIPVGIRTNDLGQIIIDEAHDSGGTRVTKMLVLDNKDGTLVK